MRALGIAAVLTAVLTVYLPHVQQASVVYEDLSIVTADGGFPGLGAMGRGLTRESWRHVRTPQAAHALNLGLHLIVVALVGLLFWQVTGRAWVSGAVASLVALHPLGLEGVAYAASRAELIAACGALVALVAVTAARHQVAWVLVPVGVVFAYAGKETGLVVVGLMPLVLWLQGRHRTAGRLFAALCGFVFVLLCVRPAEMGAWLTLGHTNRVQVGAVAWMLIQAEAVYRLVVLSVAPFWLSVSPNITHPSWAGVADLILLAGLLEVAWRCRSRAPMFFAGIVWCAVVAAPRFLVRTPLSPFNEHQWYLALPGVALVIVAGIDAVARWSEGEPCRV